MVEVEFAYPIVELSPSVISIQGWNDHLYCTLTNDYVYKKIVRHQEKHGGEVYGRVKGFYAGDSHVNRPVYLWNCHLLQTHWQCVDHKDRGYVFIALVHKYWSPNEERYRYTTRTTTLFQREDYFLVNNDLV